MNKQTVCGIVFSALLLTAAGCGGGEQPAKGSSEHAEPEPAPAKLTFYSAQGKVLEQFGALDLLKAKFPHITLEVINNQEGQRYADLIAAGIFPDIIYEANSLMQATIVEYGLQYDMEELINKHKFDLSRFEPNILAQARYSNSDGKLYGLPYSVNRYALVYNKDIFDKFGVPYPKDGMTWDEVYSLAQRVARSDGSVAYEGFAMNTPANYMLNNQLSLHPLDAKEDRANVNTDGWKTLFENIKRFYELPHANLAAPRFVDGKLAMMVGAISTGQFTQFAQNAQLNWDMVSVPVLTGSPNTGFMPAGLSLFISQNSNAKDEAFRLVDYLVSEEYQTILAKNGGGTTLSSEKVRAAAGQNLPSASNKNVKALYYYQHAPTAPPRAKQLTNVSVNFGSAFTRMIENKTDVNTTLRLLEEEINRSIAETKAKTK
ncbi:MAG: extracellular solute-binding protein family 1 [Paenibacillus sp.]|nr:extracellular solute-binding protein family 1 [Paenibacillus sp.]